MRIAVFGTGYVGLVGGVCLADLGNDVTCVDVDEKKVEMLRQGKSPIYEPGLQEKLEKNLKERRLSFSTEGGKAIEENELLFICVGTPSSDTGEVDLRYVDSVARTIGKHLNNEKVVIDKSTAPVGTGAHVRVLIQAELDARGVKTPFHIVSNPEFLREGVAIRDFMIPDRVVVGVEHGDSHARKVMERLYQSITRADKPLIVTDVRTAELIKYASNCMLATRISFMNQLSQYCELVGADITAVAKGIGLDDRIGPRFLQAGVGFGGSCFPKDVRGLVGSMKLAGADASVFEAVYEANEKQKQWVLGKIERIVGKEGKGRKVALWGLSFKPKTDDIREAPSLDIVRWLVDHGFSVSAFDPEAAEHFRKLHPQVYYAETPYGALQDAELLVLVTEWDEFRNPDWPRVKDFMKAHHVLDGRNIYGSYREELKELGFSYEGIGVPRSS